MHTTDATPPPRRQPTCPEHGGPLPCPACEPKAPPPGFFDHIRAALDAAKTTHHQREAEKAAREQAKENR